MTDNAALTAEHMVHPTRLGDLTIVRDGNALTGLYFPHHWYRPAAASLGLETDRGFDAVRRQLDEYLAGTRTAFELPLKARGSGLQRRVWELIAAVPYAQTATYGELARRMGGTTAREVGAAVGRNPLSILIPCHRIVGSNGKLTGYAGGLRRKRLLLDLEQQTAGAAAGLW